MEATYCPEDNKLRLYVGRVPREEYLKLRADGWTSTPKQDCDFRGKWSPQREDTAREYAEGLIGDEDQAPTDRAADRAERFGGYLDKRRSEAHGHADSYEAGPQVHGHQDQRRAERSAARHDRHASRAVDSWGKAEYWQHRTAGVINHALYVSAPGVRMGRIKRLETDLRKMLAMYGACDLSAIAKRWALHYELRLAYERQMLEAQGGRAGDMDIEAGGYIDGAMIVKVNKSGVTGRVVSAHLKVKQIEGWAYRVRNVPGSDYALMQVNVERMNPGRYKAPTEADRESFKVWKKADSKQRNAKLPKAPPLVNPNEKDAQRLQDSINERRVELRARGAYIGSGADTLEVCKITQAKYSECSKGAYAKVETRQLAGGAQVFDRHSDCYSGKRAKRVAAMGPVVCKVRMFGERVIVITDKPQKKLPAAVWKAPKVEAPHVS